MNLIDRWFGLVWFGCKTVCVCVFPSFTARTAERTGHGHVLRVSAAGMWVVDRIVTSLDIDDQGRQVVIGDEVGSVQVLQYIEADEFTPEELQQDAAEVCDSI